MIKERNNIKDLVNDHLMQENLVKRNLIDIENMRNTNQDVTSKMQEQDQKIKFLESMISNIKD